MAAPRQLTGDFPLVVEIVTNTAVAWKGGADQVQAPGLLGEFGVLPGHMLMLTFTKLGFVSVHQHGKIARFLVGPGVADVGPGRVTLLVDLCLPAEEIDKVHARALLETAERRLETTEPGSEEYADAQRGAEMARVQMEA